MIRQTLQTFSLQQTVEHIKSRINNYVLDIFAIGKYSRLKCFLGNKQTDRQTSRDYNFIKICK